MLSQRIVPALLLATLCAAGDVIRAAAGTTDLIDLSPPSTTDFSLAAPSTASSSSLPSTTSVDLDDCQYGSDGTKCCPYGTSDNDGSCLTTCDHSVILEGCPTSSSSMPESNFLMMTTTTPVATSVPTTTSAPAATPSVPEVPASEPTASAPAATAAPIDKKFAAILGARGVPYGAALIADGIIFQYDGCASSPKFDSFSLALTDAAMSVEMCLEAAAKAGTKYAGINGL